MTTDLMVQDIELTATVPNDMVVAQKQLVSWCDKKLVILNHEATELKEAYEHAKKMKWKISVLYATWQRSVKSICYYVKVKMALEEGYYIVPNFPIQMFAIRTTREPNGHSWHYWGDHQQDAQQLVVGKGDYQNPFPLCERLNLQKDGDRTIQEAESYPVGWDDFEFPITMAKPQIMQATSRAMALKIFDRIGIMPATKNEDPVIIGQVFIKKGYTEKIVSFMIAWHLNTNVL